MPPKPVSQQDKPGPSAPGASSHDVNPPNASSDDHQHPKEPQRQGSVAGPKKKRHRNRKSKARRQSFADPTRSPDPSQPDVQRPSLATVTEGQQAATFYRLGNRATSNSSLDSEALLDHREQSPIVQRQRGSSMLHQYSQPTRQSSFKRAAQYASSREQGVTSSSFTAQRMSGMANLTSQDGRESDDRTPLIATTNLPSKSRIGYGGTRASHDNLSRLNRRPSTASSRSSRRRGPKHQMTDRSPIESDYDVNNPPSVPGSPRLGADDGFDDVMLPEFSHSPLRQRLSEESYDNDVLIDIDDVPVLEATDSARETGFPRRRNTSDHVEDVCLPFEQMTEIGEEEEYLNQQGGAEPDKTRRRHRKTWPDLSVLEEWSEVEKEELKLEGVRAKKVDDPLLIGGRLRPQRGTWHKEDEEAPFRWTYFNDEIDSSLRSHTLSGLQQLGGSFRELFIPALPELEDSSSESEDDVGPHAVETSASSSRGRGSGAGVRQSSILDHSGFDPKPASGDHTPTKAASIDGKPKKYGPRPVFWLDVLQPTWEEMKVLSRAFGIHKLTAEDIMEQEAREKVELFRNYYFVNYRTFEQDVRSEEHMDAVNMYFVVFKGGVISFHFSQMPHPANVRRRIRQLSEHQYTDSDWIAYAIIDNITDAYAPIIEQIEEEVDDIDDEILLIHSDKSSTERIEKPKWAKKGMKVNILEAFDEKDSVSDKDMEGRNDTRRDMLLRVGECRKRVMGLYRLLGNKADVIKGLAKRCNEQWQVAPRSDVGLYLGDIQDHIVTMTGNLTHYESILSRAHSNYLAQINIGMNERAEKTNDILGKLTVIGTIVLPMNIVTGIWGMNCLVPGQQENNPNLNWFFGLVGFLILFGLTCFLLAKRVYKIV